MKADILVFMPSSSVRRARAKPKGGIAVLVTLWTLGTLSTAATASYGVRPDPCLVPDQVVVAEAGYAYATNVWVQVGNLTRVQRQAIVTEFTVLRRATGPPVESFTVVQVVPPDWSDFKSTKLVMGAAYFLLLYDATDIQPGTHEGLFLSFYVPDVSALDDDATLRERWRDLCQQRILDAAARRSAAYSGPPAPGAPTKEEVRDLVPGSYPR